MQHCTTLVKLAPFALDPLFASRKKLASATRCTSRTGPVCDVDSSVKSCHPGLLSTAVKRVERKSSGEQLLNEKKKRDSTMSLEVRKILHKHFQVEMYYTALFKLFPSPNQKAAVSAHDWKKLLRKQQSFVLSSSFLACALQYTLAAIRWKFYE